ncbi:MAG: helix-turn-helix domain-containing protein [Candidatus Pacearchaeota archaeon]
MLGESLIKAGLTRVESKVYLTLIDLGPSLAGQISKKSGIHRRTIYDALDRLAEKGLISYIIKNNRKYFEAVNPKRLIDLEKEREEQLKSELPELIKLFMKTKAKEETLFYRGKDGLKTAFEDQITEGKEILVMGASPEAGEILQFYFKWYNKRRQEKHIKLKLIADISAKGKIKAPLSEIRYLPNLGPAAINIYADKVAIILWNKERPLAIIIKNAEIANSYRIFFEHMWKIAKH